MNTPPKTAKRMAPAALQRFAQSVLMAVGMPESKAAFLAECLTTNDARGVFSHGTQQLRAYPRAIKEGHLNPDPEVTLTSESPSTLALDGDGGLGYFAAFDAANRLVPKAKEVGIAAALTSNHGHFGAAGIYARIIVQAGLIAYITSGHQLGLNPEAPIGAAAGGSPMAFGIPTRSQPPFVLDFGTMQDIYPGEKHAAEIFELAPGVVFRSIGLGAVCQVLGGLLTGLPIDPARATRRYQGANQGSFMIALDITRFMPMADFTREMDEYIERASKMRPLPGQETAALPGGPEWNRERAAREQGIPIGEHHESILRKVGEAFGVTLEL